MRGKEVADLGPDLGRLKPRPAMARAGNANERALHAGLRQCLVEQLALADRNRAVFLAVHDQKGRIILAHVGDGVGAGSLFLVVLNRAAQQLS